MLVFDINVSHGSVATRLRCSGIFHNDFIANLPLSLSVKEFYSTFGEVTDKSSGMFFFDSQCMYVLCEWCRHDIQQSTNAIVNQTSNDLRQLSTLTSQTPDNRVGPQLFHIDVLLFVQ